MRAATRQQQFTRGARFYKPTLWYVPDRMNVGDSTMTMTQSTLYVLKYTVSRPTTFDRISLEVTSNVGSAVGRLGLYYSDSSNAYPGSLFAEAGTFDASTASASLAITVSWALQPGIYWAAVVSQGAAAIVRARNPGSDVDIGQAAANNANVTGFSQASVTAELPTTFTATPAQIQTILPKLMLRAA